MQSALKVLVQNIATLVNIKSIVTLAIIGCLCVLVLRQNTRITSEMFAAVVSSVITYFFIKSVDKAQSSEDATRSVQKE